MRSLREANALLEAQRAALSGDDHVRREVAPWRDATPAERLAGLALLCADAVIWWSRLSPAELARATAPDPLPQDALPIARTLRRGAR